MAKYRGVFILYSIIICISLVISGCWSNKDLNERALIVGVGLDKSDDGQIEFTMQVVNPAVVGSQESGSDQENAVWIHTSKGTTVYDAIRNQFKVSNKRSFYSHIQLIVIGEEMARDGIGDVLDFFERNHETRLTSNILVAKGTTAEKILRVKSDLEQIPVVHLQGIISNHEKSGEIESTKLIDVVKTLSNEGIEPTISAIEIINQDVANLDMHDIEIHGSGVFREDKLIGWLEPEETKGLLYTKDKVLDGMLTIENPHEKGKLIAIEQVNSSTKLDVNIIENKPHFSITIDAKGSIAGQQGRSTALDPETLHQFEALVKEEMRRIVLNAVSVSQKKFKCDIIGFGELMHIKYTEYWKQVKDDWPEIYSRTPVDIKVDFKILKTGRISAPI